jgi:hypothetical protein
MENETAGFNGVEVRRNKEGKEERRVCDALAGGTGEATMARGARMARRRWIIACSRPNSASGEGRVYFF